ncbi:ketopantoate reductase family protein [Natronorubrum daqingense]|uniref:2-dehydropantoate 2-reductase n=1 Tax=Natronorubrum daqingense TaxID=588898 RepID=A0A1N7F5J6_9EURY|nr:2-dehydropantoate 2-reductase [Natronorubrum daqingense]APX97551.1 2-dehydropantoate 2-reductase [Natronorubrum daqingense]SIR95628.1 ketopantoate reductase [Natronorubrum daqingense]
MNIVVFGAGSVGSLVGGLLARERSNDVTLVGRDPHISAIQRSGLEIRGELEASTTPAATTDGRHLEGDLAIVTVKSFDTVAAARTLATGSFDAVLSLQNGLGNEATIETHLECPVLAGTASYGAILVEPGLVECTGIGEVVLGARDGGKSRRADEVGALFDSAGLETTVDEEMPCRLWEKLAVNTGINPVTALTRTDNAAVLEDEARPLARGVVRETARTARASGISLSNREALTALESVASDTAANTSSMHQDVLAGQRTEIDSLNGYVVDQSAKVGVETPMNHSLTSLVRTWERGKGLR